MGVLLAMLPFPVTGQYTLYTCMVQSKGYVVGAKLPPSGIFVKAPTGEWRHAGYQSPFHHGNRLRSGRPVHGLCGRGQRPAAGANGGDHWKILTGSDVTELLDVAVDRNAPGTIYFSHTAGIRVSHDRGATWQDASAGLHRKYTAAIRVDSAHSGFLVAGNEEGIFRSEDGGRSWRLAGAAGLQVLHIEQSPHDPCFWLAATEGGGLFASTDCGVSFESAGNLGVGRNLYDIAFDPPPRIASPWRAGDWASPSRKTAARLGSCAMPAFRRLRSGAWHSTPPSPAASMPAFTKRRSTFLTIPAAPGAKTAWKAAAVYRMRFVPEGRR